MSYSNHPEYIHHRYLKQPVSRNQENCQTKYADLQTVVQLISVYYTFVETYSRFHNIPKLLGVPAY